MRVSVSGDLQTVLRRFRPRDDAHLRVELSESGLDVIGDAEGYRTLARWCLVMAHPEMRQVHPRWLYSLMRLSEAAGDPAFASVVFRNDCGQRELPLRDVRFFRVASNDPAADFGGKLDGDRRA